MTTFHLVRHGEAAVPLGVLAGREPGIGLTALGREQIQQLVPRLANEDVHAIVCSPLQRTRESAEILAAELGLAVQTAEPLGELDFGRWTMRSWNELDDDPAWRRFNAFRSGTQIPTGEWMCEVQSRVVRWLLAWRNEAPDAAFIIVTHGDVIRAALLYFAGMPLDFVHRIEIGLASLTTLRIDAEGAVILGVNWTP